MPTFQLNTETYLDQCNKCYKNIIVINKMPESSPLKTIVKMLRREKLSPFDVESNCVCRKPCLFAIMNPHNKSELLCMDDIAELFDFLITNGYTINDKITKFMGKKNSNLICFISI
jgi:hypothetical protein